MCVCLNHPFDLSGSPQEWLFKAEMRKDGFSCVRAHYVFLENKGDMVSFVDGIAVNLTLSRRDRTQASSFLFKKGQNI